ncbi:Peptidase family S41 [Pedobacter westerhofensis]|uniref:Peptidase family S41 n=1 Tax=Pedobacter westerhofensis TaxID=425512 RepID=A0A521FUB5_9SPHI|nr:S41 family peptidase [Pedobacter westerhofensis]SMO99131.1 Peptidase family S41 [Pedobacter westerhofensis]
MTLFYSLSAFPQSTERQQRNLKAFARLYGCVQYFHPSSEAPKDWAVLAVYGSKKMLSTSNDTELIAELNSIFNRVAPSVQIFSTSAPQRFDFKKIKPSNIDGYSIVSWQHLGLGLPLYAGIYKSIKLNIPYGTKDKKPVEQLFKTRTKIGEYLKTDIVEGISCIVPYALYSKQGNTYPAAAPLATQELMREMGNALPKDSSGKLSLTGSSPEIRLADVIIAWNILKHSYPYWNDASLPAETILTKAIKKSISDKNPEDFLNTLRLMCAEMNDGHMFVDLTQPKEKSNEATASLTLTEAEGKIVVKKINNQKLGGVELGDTVDSIEHQDIMKYLLSREEYLSGSPQWKRSKSLVMALNGPKNTSAPISISGKNGKRTFLAERNMVGLGYRSGSENEPYTKEGWLRPEIYYINLSRDSVTKKLIVEQLFSAKAIIFDLRGYPLNDEVFNILPHLINKPLKKRQFFFIPQIIYPDFERVGYQRDRSRTNAETPFIKAKIYVLTDASAQSASETFLAQVKGLPNVTIIGTPSSGTNGNINVIYLPGKYTIAYTGMITKNADGSKHHLKGIIPDIILTPTIDGIKNGLDEPLNLAIKIAKEQSR